MSARLGINIDHIATLRQARKEFYPSVAQGAEIALNAGAEQITIHLREDRRHIQEFDVFDVKKITEKNNKLLNLEMACDEGVVKIAKEVRPEWICLVPEKRLEMTTEGGLDLGLDAVFYTVKNCVESLKKDLPETSISLFLESKPEILEKAVSLDIQAVEIHTGNYAKAFLENEEILSHLKEYEAAYSFLTAHKKGVHAGHGLTLESLKPLVDQNFFQEYNIGHWVISEAIFYGLETVVSQLRMLIDEKK